MGARTEQWTSAAPAARTSGTEVALTGSGLCVDLLATVLARAGLEVTVCASGPRGVPGATSVPYTAELFYLLAARFGVPEIARLARYDDAPRAVAAGSGVKKNLGFVHHRPRRAPAPEENVQFAVPGEHVEWHIDLAAAEQYTRELAEDYGARYLDDATPPSDALVLDLSRPADPGILRAQARFEGLERYEDLRSLGDALPWSEGTLVHSFPSGWVQVAPFDNTPGGRGRGALVSISVPGAPDDDPDAVLDRLRARYPDLGLQFRAGRRVAPWDVSSSGSGSAEVLFGQDLTMGLELVHAAAAILLAPGALRTPLASLRAFHRFRDRLEAENARFAAAARAATGSFPSWHAFTHLWLLWSISSALALKKARLEGARSGDWAAASRFGRGTGWLELAPGIADRLDWSVAAMEEVAEHGRPAQRAAGPVFRLMSDRRVIPPLYRFGDPQTRRYRLSLATRLKLMSWLFTVAPREYRGMFTADNVTAVPPDPGRF